MEDDSGWFSAEDFAADYIAALLPQGKSTYVRTDGNTVEFADPHAGIFLITVTAAELAAA